VITLRFLWSWSKTALLTILALVIERAVITGFWGFALAATITLTLFVIITVGLFREWRAHAAGYTHQLTNIRRDGGL